MGSVVATSCSRPPIRQHKATQMGSNRDNQGGPSEVERSALGELTRGPDTNCLCRHITFPSISAGTWVRSHFTRLRNAIRPSTCYSGAFVAQIAVHQDRKSTRLNSSHGYISYAVFCL